MSELYKTDNYQVEFSTGKVVMPLGSMSGFGIFY
jgi:hypothetical protein